MREVQKDLWKARLSKKLTRKELEESVRSITQELSRRNKEIFEDIKKGIGAKKYSTQNLENYIEYITQTGESKSHRVYYNFSKLKKSDLYARAKLGKEVLGYDTETTFAQEYQEEQFSNAYTAFTENTTYGDETSEQEFRELTKIWNKIKNEGLLARDYGSGTVADNYHVYRENGGNWKDFANALIEISKTSTNQREVGAKLDELIMKKINKEI